MFQLVKNLTQVPTSIVFPRSVPTRSLDIVPDSRGDLRYNSMIDMKSEANERFMHTFNSNLLKCMVWSLFKDTAY